MYSNTIKKNQFDLCFLSPLTQTQKKPNKQKTQNKKYITN